MLDLPILLNTKTTTKKMQIAFWQWSTENGEFIEGAF